MRILHTADIHLRTTGDTRWQALEHLLELADREGVSALVVSGDLFDRRVDVAGLKGPLRDLFGGAGLRVVILPGNHDARAVVDGDYYGDNVTILDRAGRYIDVEEARIFGLPFERIEGEKILERLYAIRQEVKPGGTNILLYHGELVDMLFSRDRFGEEDQDGYMPVRLWYFDDLGIDYVLAGHLHSSFEVRTFRGGYFVYPGSPVSITRKETGVRQADLLEVGKQPVPVELETSHYEEVVVRLNPFSGDDPLDEVRKRLRRCNKNARVLLTVSGLVDLSALDKTESEFGKQIGALMTPQIEKITQPWKDVGVILENDLFRRSMQKLDAKRLPRAQVLRIRELIVESMMESQDAN